MGVVAPVSASAPRCSRSRSDSLGGERPPAARVARHRSPRCRGSGWSAREPADEDVTGDGRRGSGVLDGVLAGLGFGTPLRRPGQIPEAAGYWPLALTQLVALPRSSSGRDRRPGRVGPAVAGRVGGAARRRPGRDGDWAFLLATQSRPADRHGGADLALPRVHRAARRHRAARARPPWQAVGLALCGRRRPGRRRLNHAAVVDPGPSFAAATLCACTATTPRDEATPSSSPPSTRTVAPTTAPPSPARPITIALAGDVHFEGVLRARLDDPATALAPVAGALAAADLAVVNLETSVGSGGSPDPAKRFTFQAPPSALRRAGRRRGRRGEPGQQPRPRLRPRPAPRHLRRPRRGPVGRPAARRGRPRPRRRRRLPPRAHRRRRHPGRDGRRHRRRRRPDRRPDRAMGGDRDRPGTADAIDPGRLLRAVRAADREADVVVAYLHWGVQGEACPTPGSAPWPPTWSRPAPTSSPAATPTGCRATAGWAAATWPTGSATTPGTPRGLDHRRPHTHRAPPRRPSGRARVVAAPGRRRASAQTDFLVPPGRGRRRLRRRPGRAPGTARAFRTDASSAVRPRPAPTARPARGLGRLDGPYDLALGRVVAGVRRALQPRTRQSRPDEGPVVAAALTGVGSRRHADSPRRGEELALDRVGVVRRPHGHPCADARRGRARSSRGRQPAHPPSVRPRRPANRSGAARGPSHSVAPRPRRR